VSPTGVLYYVRDESICGRLPTPPSQHLRPRASSVTVRQPAGMIEAGLVVFGNAAVDDMARVSVRGRAATELARLQVRLSLRSAR
jgi:hypothetical protein